MPPQIFVQKIYKAPDSFRFDISDVQRISKVNLLVQKVAFQKCWFCKFGRFNIIYICLSGMHKKDFSMDRFRNLIITFFPNVSNLKAFNGTWPNKVKFIETMQGFVFHKICFVDKQMLGWNTLFVLVEIRREFFFIFTQFSRWRLTLTFIPFSLHILVFKELNKLISIRWRRKTLIIMKVCHLHSIYIFHKFFSS